MKVVVLLAAALLASAAHAQLGWRKAPAIVIVAADGDPRIALVDEAIAYWNRALEEAGAGLRLPAAGRANLPIPEQALQEVSAALAANPRGPIDVPQSLRELPGDLTIVLAHTVFISFASPFYEKGRRIVGIRANTYPLTLPNVMRNLIAHELGHAIGMGHNADPALLMCGRPAPCRPPDYASDTPRYFPISEGERSLLRRMYPPL